MTLQVGLCDIEVPRAVIVRKIKSATGNKPVQKEAKLALTKAVTVFISYLTAQALTEASGEPKVSAKYLSASQVFEALNSLGFSNLHEEVARRRAELKAANANIPSDPNSEGVDDDDLGTPPDELPVIEIDDRHRFSMEEHEGIEHVEDYDEDDDPDATQMQESAASILAPMGS